MHTPRLATQRPPVAPIGNGLSYNGVPLVQTPGTGTLVRSSDPACKVPDGDKFTFPPAPEPREWHLPVTLHTRSPPLTG
jgi:hypothetical protein